MRILGVRFLLSVSVLGSAVCHCPGIGTSYIPHRTIPQNWLQRTQKTHQYVGPLSSRQPPSYGIFKLGQCHFPLCMWIIEIRLSTVIVHCVEPSVIVNQNVLRDFLYTGKKKKKGGANERLTCKEKDENTTQHERAFIVLCIYAIVYVWIWRIWKYMLTNLYRVFYVMWNTWSRCSLLSLALHLFLSFVFFISLSLVQTEHIRRTRLTLLTAFFFFFWNRKATCAHTRDAGSRQKCRLSQIGGGREKNIVVHSCWLKHRKGGGR